MYNQSAQWVSRRRRARPRRPAERGRGAAPRSRERVRLIQLGVCLALFLVVFVGRGASPSGRMAQLQQGWLDANPPQPTEELEKIDPSEFYGKLQSLRAAVQEELEALAPDSSASGSSSSAGSSAG